MKEQTDVRPTPVRVPDTLEEVLSPPWLTAALGQRFPGIEVTAVTPGPVVSRVSTNARFQIECTGGLPAGLSPQLCAKGYFSETQQPYRHVGESEACFYRYLAEPSGVRTLRSVYADVDPYSRHGVVITEDVVVTGATFLDALSPYSPDQVAASLEELAKLHSSTWEAPRWRDPVWLAPRLESYFGMRGIDDIRGNFEGPIGARVPDSTRHAERAPDLLPGLGRRVLVADSVVGPAWRCAHRQRVPRWCRPAVLPRLAIGATRPVVPRRRIPHRLRLDRGGPETHGARVAGPLSRSTRHGWGRDPCIRRGLARVSARDPVRILSLGHHPQGRSGDHLDIAGAPRHRRRRSRRPSCRPGVNLVQAVFSIADRRVRRPALGAGGGSLPLRREWPPSGPRPSTA